MAGIRKMSQLEKIFKDKIQDAMENEVAQEVKKTQQKGAMKVVYSRYSPTRYKRRYTNNGLLSKENIKHKTNRTKSGVKLEISNFTKMFGDDNYLAPLIVLGHDEHKRRYGYGYSSYERHLKRYRIGISDEPTYGYPRDFISWTRNKMRSSGSHIDSLKEGLKRQGVKVK